METLTDKLTYHETTSPIIDKINGVLSEEFEVDIDRMLPGENIRKTLDLDSLDYIDLVVVRKQFFLQSKPEDFIHSLVSRILYVYHLWRSI